MKKIMLIALMGMIFLTETSVANEMKPCMSAPTGVWIKLLVNLHRPKLNCESGFGLCFLLSWGFEENSAASESKLCPVRGQLNDRNQLLLEIEETALSRYEGGASLQYIRDKTSVTISDPYPIPEATCRALGANTALTVKPGNYPVSFQNGVYTIVFQL